MAPKYNNINVPNYLYVTYSEEGFNKIWKHAYNQKRISSYCSSKLFTIWLLKFVIERAGPWKETICTDFVGFIKSLRIHWNCHANYLCETIAPAVFFPKAGRKIWINWVKIHPLIEL